MDANILMELLGSYGFPIVCCGAMFWYMTQQDKRHKEEVDKLSEAINNNTLIITKLYEAITRGE